MTYNEAVKMRDANRRLVGTVDSKGFVISDVIIVPAESNSRERFLRHYLLTQDAIESLSPYVNEDLVVWAVDTKHLIEANVLFYSELTNE